MNDTPAPDQDPSPGPVKIELQQEWTDKPQENPETIANTPPDLPHPIATQGPTQAINREILGALTLSVLNIPSVVWGPHLVRTEAQINPVVEPLALVLEKYDIDLDKAPEVLLVLSSLGILTGFIIDDRKHKENSKGALAPDQAPTQEATAYFEKIPEGIEG